LELGGQTSPVDGDVSRQRRTHVFRQRRKASLAHARYTYPVTAERRGVDPRCPVLETRLLAGARSSNCLVAAPITKKGRILLGAGPHYEFRRMVLTKPLRASSRIRRILEGDDEDMASAHRRIGPTGPFTRTAFGCK